MKYEILTMPRLGQGQVQKTDVDVSSSSGASNFPPLYFSKVRSYLRDAQAPLG